MAHQIDLSEKFIPPAHGLVARKRHVPLAPQRLDPTIVVDSQQDIVAGDEQVTDHHHRCTSRSWTQRHGC